MKWRKSRRSQNIEDRRGGAGYKRGRSGSGRQAFRGVKFKSGIGLVLAIVGILFFGGDLGDLLTSSTVEPVPQSQSQRSEPTLTPREQVEQVLRGSPDQRPDQDKDFVAAILGSTEDVWRQLFPSQGYRPPTVVLYQQGTSTGCGYGFSASGPFYCPADEKVYLDTQFFDELARMGGQGDFAKAYVIAHEVAHHVQHLVGTTSEVRRLQARVPRDKNALSVRLELQADCLAGVWAHHSNDQLDWISTVDIQKGLDAAAAVGDDRLSHGHVSPDAFTHGTSEQRQQWLMRGIESGDPNACDTFGNEI